MDRIARDMSMFKISPIKLEIILDTNICWVVFPFSFLLPFLASISFLRHGVLPFHPSGSCLQIILPHTPITESKCCQTRNSATARIRTRYLRKTRKTAYPPDHLIAQNLTHTHTQRDTDRRCYWCTQRRIAKYYNSYIQRPRKLWVYP